MAELKGALDQALSGHGRLAMLVGEPGIGKTRLAQELASVAEARGAQVLWGRCYEEGGTPPYWPWAQAIRSHIRVMNHEQLRSEMGAGAADIAEVISDLQQQYPDLERPPDLARFRLFNSITTFLKNAAQAQPIVLVLDDLHWSDTPSLALVEFLSREIVDSNLLVIGTYRDMELSRQHPLSKTLGGLARERLYQRIPLRGLDLEELGQLIQATAGISPSPALIQTLQSHAEGNPFFAIEVVRLLAQEGELTPEGSAERQAWEIRIPEGVREVIGRRLDRLTDLCNRALTIASVLGREFSLEHLKPLIEDPWTDSGQAITENRLLEVLEEALHARVIEELPGEPGLYQFTHALIQETLSAELGLTRRVRLQAQIAEALEEIFGDNAEAHAAELARRFADAEAVLGPDRLVRYSLLAGEQALTAYAWEEAQSHFERGLAARSITIAGNDPLPNAEAAALTFGFGRARFGTDARRQMGEAANSLTRAFDYYVRSAETTNAISVAEYPVPMSPAARTGMTPIIRQALTLVAPGTLSEGRLLALYGVQLGRVEGNYPAAQEAFDRALATAYATGDVGLELNTLTGSADVDFFSFGW